MKQRLQTGLLRQVFLLAALLMLTLTTAHAQESVRKTAGNSVEIKEDPATRTSRINAANAEMERKDKALLDELIQSDPVIKAEGAAAEVPGDSTERTAETSR